MDGRWIDAGLDAGWTLLDNSMELEARRSSPDEAYDGNEDLESEIPRLAVWIPNAHSCAVPGRDISCNRMSGCSDGWPPLPTQKLFPDLIGRLKTAPNADRHARFT